MAGVKAKYYKSLSHWCVATGGDSAEVEGVPGASVGAGRTLTVSLDLAEALFDAGYELHNDAAVEDLRDSPSEIVLQLGTEGLSRPVAGEVISPASPAKCEDSAFLTTAPAVPVAGVEAEMSVRRSDSDLMWLNQARGGIRGDRPAGLVTVLRAELAIVRGSGEAFEIRLGHATAA